MKLDSELNLGGDPIYTRVCDKLREEILSGIFAAGERLKIAELSTRYGVSMMPVREALQKLEGEGMIVLEANKGARVRGIDRHFIECAYDIRGAIEGMLMHQVSALITTDQLQAAAALNTDYESAVRPSNWPQAMNLNKQFHQMLYQIANNAEALVIINQRWGLIDCLRRQFGFGARRVTQVIEEHRLLIAALAARDSEKAETITRQHAEGAKRDLLDRMAASGTV